MCLGMRASGLVPEVFLLAFLEVPASTSEGWQGVIGPSQSADFGPKARLD